MGSLEFPADFNRRLLELSSDPALSAT